MFGFFGGGNQEEEKKANSMIEVKKMSAESMNPSFVDSELPSTAAATTAQGGSQKNLFQFKNDLKVNS